MHFAIINYPSSTLILDEQHYVNDARSIIAENMIPNVPNTLPWPNS